MITSNIMLCADRVIRDVKTNNISVINILEEITPVGLPIFIQRFMVFAILCRESEDDPSKVRCQIRINIGTNKLVEHGIQVDFKGKKRNRTIADIGGLVIPSSGTLETSIYLDERMLNSYRFEIREPRTIQVTQR